MNKRFCTQCGQEIGADVQYCPACGTKLKEITPIVNEDTTYDLDILPSKKEAGIHGIYLLDFLSTLTKKSNIPLLIYLVLNVLIIGSFTTYILYLPIGYGMVCGLLLYIAGIAIALSPFGEWMVRYQNNCKKISDQYTINRLEPIFREVYYKAKKENPALPNDIRLFINEEKAPNAFATGRRTLCITRGLLSYSDDEIKGTLAHEFGHLSHKDTDRILVIAVGNMAVTAIAFMIQLAAILFDVFSFIASLFVNVESEIRLFAIITRFLTIIIIGLLMRIWSGIGVMLCMKTSRSNEFEADAFATKLGFGQGLISTLSSLPDYRPKGLFASLASSHPNTSVRIEKIRENMR